MYKSFLIILLSLTVSIDGNQASASQTTVSSLATFIKPNANIMRRLNPLKLLFNVVYQPAQTPSYSVEWNFSFLKTILLESTHVTDEDKQYFVETVADIEHNYGRWSVEQHEKFERFTEKYFNLYKSPASFLPMQDCSSFTFAVMDEILNDLQPNINQDKRSQVRAKAVERLCNVE
jgi:hypothetical protein